MAEDTVPVKESSTENSVPTLPNTSNTVEPDPSNVRDAVEFELDTTNDPVITASPVNGKVDDAGKFVKFEPSPTK